MANNYLICDNCQHKNSVTSERIVFCKSCDKKLENNYLDWKKSKFNSSFETYVKGLNEYNESIAEKTILENPIQKKKPLFKSTISSPSKTSLIFFAAVFIQILIAAIIMQSNEDSITTVGRKTAYKASITTSDLNEVKWGTYPITQNLSLSLPFEVKESNSVLPCYMENYVTNHKSTKAESSSQSFSVTIEKMDFDSLYKIQNQDFVSLNDAYMKSPGVILQKEEVLHTIIKGYKTYVEHGSYMKDGNEYSYENYTLTKGNEGVKIILSYLKHDELICKYADIVTQSLLKNKHVI
jgi:hypothetical protein